MTQDKYQQTYYCNCPKSGELPLFRNIEKGQWAVCEPCKIRWMIGLDVLENCEEDAQNTLEGLSPIQGTGDGRIVAAQMGL